MKKAVYLLVTVAFLLLAGCGCAYGYNEDSTNNDANNPTINDPVFPEPFESMSIRSLTQLEEMRKMILCEDENTLSKFLTSVEGSSAHSREDLINFVSLVEPLPVIELIYGSITWIAHYNSNGSDIVFISTTAPNGDWTRVEYQLSVKDPVAEIESMKSSGVLTKNDIITTIQSHNGRIQVFSEKNAPHPSGVGETCEWTMIVDDILVRVVYYTTHQNKAEMPDILTKIRLTDLLKGNA